MPNQISSNESQWTIIDILNWTTSYFESRDVESPRMCAELILAHVLRLKRIDLYIRYDQPLLPEELAQFKALIKRRIHHEPAAYILGSKEFWSMDFVVTPDVLIPRPETECLVEAALAQIEIAEPDSRLLILDLGTGSGAIALALAAQEGQHLYFASDLSQAAVKIAKKNAIRHALNDKVTFFVGDWLHPLHTTRGRFDMILSNPPYIRRREMAQLQPDIVDYEPAMALDGDKTGLECIRQIIETAYRHLKKEGDLILEIGYDQGETVIQMISQNGHYTTATVKKDYSGHDRVVQTRRR